MVVKCAFPTCRGSDVADMDATLSNFSEQVARARATGRPLVIRGGGTRLFYGSPLPPEDSFNWLDMSSYSGVVHYEPTELVLTARAGTPLAEIETLLAAHGQMLAFEPPRFGPADTFGGCVATGLSGPRRMASGPLSDFVLGCRLLNADGKVLHFGGEVMKNVAGYDMSRLLAGSLGVLGPLLEISIKVAPRPRCEATCMLDLDEQPALAACLDWRAKPIAVSATAWMNGPNGAGGRLCVRLSGNESAVRHGMSTIGGERLGDADADTFWRSLRDQTHVAFRARPLWRVTLPAGAPPLEQETLLDEWGGSLRWLDASTDAAALRARVRAMGGFACLHRREGARDDVPTFDPLAPALLEIHRRLKQEFDADAIFNRGRMYPVF